MTLVAASDAVHFGRFDGNDSHEMNLSDSDLFGRVVVRNHLEQDFNVSILTRLVRRAVVRNRRMKDSESGKSGIRIGR